ncbi:hypothetical protein [Algihabitans albus]|uniref:hypothetical protein n=1 Tax=Algihabitans albus TaxID=2164067 RepID=UPI000E5C8E9D|nr:hypothetical protein [Algihabitans albus]
MDLIYFLESGGTLLLAGLILVFVIGRKKAATGVWPTSLVLANGLVISMVGLTALGIVLFIKSFSGT